MLALLDQTLATVPMLSTLGIRAEESTTGKVVLRLPVSTGVTNHSGALHSSAIFALGELAAATVLGTHMELAELTHFLKSSRIKYYAPSHHDVTAHTELQPEQLDAIHRDLPSGAASVEVVVQVLDGHGRDVAQLVSHFSLRPR